MNTGRAVGETGCFLGSSPSASPYLVPITSDEQDPWRVLVTVCTADGSCVDAARGSMSTFDSQMIGGEN